MEVPREDVDRYLRSLGYTPDTRDDVRDSKAREITYSKKTQDVHGIIPGKFVISPAFDGKFTGKSMLVDAPNLEDVVSSSLNVARTKCLDAYHDKGLDKPGHAVIYPKGANDKSVCWVITQYTEKRGELLVRVYTSISGDEDTAREVGKDAIRVAVEYDANGFKRGLEREQRVYRTGTVEGVLNRLGERIAEAEECQLTFCQRCGSPAYKDSGACILKECREAAKSAYRQGGPCFKCGGSTYTDSGRCIDRDCRLAGGCHKQNPD